MKKMILISILLLGACSSTELVEDKKTEKAKEERIPATAQVKEEVDLNSELKDYDRDLEKNFNAYMKAISGLQPLLNVSIEAGKREEILTWIKEVDAVSLNMVEKSSALIVDNPPSERQDKATYAQEIDAYTTLYVVTFKDFMTTGDPEYRKLSTEYLAGIAKTVKLLQEQIDYDKKVK